MGGGQANSGQAKQAAAQQTAASNQDMALSKQNQAQQSQLFSTLFGKGGPSGGGTLSGMLDPNSLNAKGLNPAYQTQFNQASDQIAKNYAGQRGSLAQAFANQGATSGSTPSGFQADQMRKLGNSEADTRGATYTGMAGQQHQDALQNFWNASNIASGNAATSGQTATTGAGNSGSSSAALYGTAGQPRPGIGTSLIGAAGTVGGGLAQGAAMCPAEGTQILMADGRRLAVEHIKAGDKVIGVDGKPDEIVADSIQSVQDVVEVRTAENTTRVSLTHAFVRRAGGYTIAAKCLGEMLETDNGPRTVLEVRRLKEKMACRHIMLKRSHGYNCDGMWSLE